MATRALAADTRIVGRTLLPGGEFRLALVSLRDARINAVAPAATMSEGRAMRRTPGAAHLSADEVLAPAYIDVHCHGAGGGAADGGLEGLSRMAATLLAHGVVGFLATFQTAPLPALRTAALAVAEQMAYFPPLARPCWGSISRGQLSPLSARPATTRPP